MTRAPRSRDDDWVRVVIREDGANEFASYRMIGVFHGNGVLTLRDGRRKLRAVGVAKNGVEYSTDLTPAK